MVTLPEPTETFTDMAGRGNDFTRVFLIACWLLVFTPVTLCSSGTQITQCGEVISLDNDRPTIQLTSRNQHRLQDDVDNDCLWFIRGPPGTTIQLDVVEYGGGPQPGDSLTVFDGVGDESDPVVELNGDHETRFTSTGRAVTCRLPVGSREITELTIQATMQGKVSIEAANPGQCGGYIYLSETSPIATINATNSYPSGGAAYCWWYIYSPSQTNIVFTFRELRIYYPDVLQIYDHIGRFLMYIYDMQRVPNPVFSNSYSRFLFDRYYSVSDSSVSIEVSYADNLESNEDGVLLSSAGVVELNDNTTSLTIKSVNHTDTHDDAYFAGYWYVTSPPGTRVKVAYHELLTGNAVHFNAYDSSGTSRPFSSFSNPSTMPGDTVFTSNVATFRLYSGWYYPGDGVVYTVSLTDESRVVGSRSCGGEISLSATQPNFTLNSPYYYDQQRSSGVTSCWWYVSSPYGKEAKLTWLDVDTSSEYVRLYDYPSSTNYQVSEFLGDIDTNLSPFVSTRGGVTVYLDDSSSGYGGKGFLADVSISDETSDVGPRSCGGSIALSNSMPNFTLNYPYYYQSDSTGRVDCRWYVTSPPGQQVQLTWLDIGSLNEYVRVYDYPTSTSYPLSYIQGDIDVEILPLVSSRGGLTLWYDDSSSGTNGRGFLVEFTLTDSTDYTLPASCGGTIPLTSSSPVVRFATPYYNQQSTSSVFMECYMYITSPSGRQVQLTMLDMETSSYEEIEIYDYPSSTSSSYLISRLSGRLETNATFISSRGGLTFFYDDNSNAYNGPGVLVEARIIDSTPSSQPGFCGGTLALTDDSSNYIFTTPLYSNPSSASVTMDCWMYITSPSGRQVQLTILDMETSNEEIEIYDYPSSTSASYLISRLSGRLETNATFISSRGGLTFFYDDNSNAYNGPGVLVEARIIEPTLPYVKGSCGGTFSMSTSYPRLTLTTPLFFQPSTSNVLIYCWWYFTSQSGKQVEMSINDMETVSEYLYIYDHPSSRTSSKQLSSLRGNVSESTVVSTSGGLSLYFNDGSTGRNGRGFLLDASITDEFSWDENVFGSCGQTVQLDYSSPSIVFSTLTYPSEVLNDYQQCFWYFTCPSGYRIIVTFLDFDIYSNSRFEVTDYTYRYSTYRLADISARSIPGTAGIQSSSNRLTAYYYDADWSDPVNQRGVLANVSMVPLGGTTWNNNEPMSSCGSAITLAYPHDSITLATPDYVSGDYMLCTWFVESPYDTMIQIHFNNFWLDPSSWIRVYNGPTTAYSLLLHATGSTIPNSVETTSNAMTIHYSHTSGGTTGTGASFVVRYFYEADPTTPRDIWETTTQDEGTSFPPTWQPGSCAGLCGGYSNGCYCNNVCLRLNDCCSDYIEYCGYPNATTEVISTLSGTTEEPERVHVLCDSTSMTVLLDKDLLDDGTHESDVHFEDDFCVGYNHDQQSVGLYTRYDRCLTKFEETEDIIIYSNVVTYYTPKPITNTSITRETILKIPVRCELDRHRLLGESFVPKTGEITFSEEGYGNFSLSLDRYPDQTFNHPVVDKEAEVDLGDPLFFAVNLTTVTRLTVFIENCWATPTPYPNGGKTYSFLSNGCAEDPTLHFPYHYDSSFEPFWIDAFTFIDENPQVYIHCEVLVCDSEPTSRCAKGCQHRVRRSGRQDRGTSSTPHLISNGPLSSRRSEVLLTKADPSDGRTMGLTAGILIGALIGIACMIVSMATMFVYMKSPRRVRHRYHRIDDHEDDNGQE